MQLRHKFFQKQLYKLNKRRNYKNEYNSIQKSYIQLFNYKGVKQICNSACNGNYKYNGTAHACCGFNIFGNTEKRADAEELA